MSRSLQNAPATSLRRSLGFLLCCAALASCNQESGPVPAATPPTRLEVQPAAANLVAGGSVQLTAVFTPAGADARVVWSVLESGGGTVSSAGLYQAPAVAGTFHVAATSVAAPGVSGQTGISVSLPLSVSIAPQSAVACVATQLIASVAGSTQTVRWTVPDTSCGTITTSGLFTSVRGTGACNVTACSTVNTSACATAAATVTAEQVLKVTVAPTAPALLTGATQAFGATVTTSCGTFAAGG